MGGSISCESSGLGHGAIFTATFRLHAKPTSRKPSVDSEAISWPPSLGLYRPSQRSSVASEDSPEAVKACAALLIAAAAAAEDTRRVEAAAAAAALAAGPAQLGRITPVVLVVPAAAAAIGGRKARKSSLVTAGAPAEKVSLPVALVLVTPAAASRRHEACRQSPKTAGYPAEVVSLPVAFKRMRVVAADDDSLCRTVLGLVIKARALLRPPCACRPLPGRLCCAGPLRRRSCVPGSQRAGFDCTLCTNGEEVEALVRASPGIYDLIIMDGSMGGGAKDGLPTLRRLQALYAALQARTRPGALPARLQASVGCARWPRAR